jgi:soluble cytochrome b562
MKNLKKHTLSVLCLMLIGVAWVQSPVYAGEIKRTMKQMNQAFKGAMNSSSIAEMAPFVASLKEQGLAAARMSLSGSASEQSDYRQGMQQMQNNFIELDRAIASGNLDAAKNILQNIKNTEKVYHRKLGV